ncbi:MAG: hypothetical protein ACYCQI_01580 [Gammaproteobacteria bacterium]
MLRSSVVIQHARKRKKTLNLDLSLDEKAIFASLNFANEDLLIAQWETVYELAHAYESGSDEATQDKWKAKQYHLRAQTVTAADLECGNALFNTSQAYNALAWYNSARIAIARIHRPIEVHYKALLPKKLGNLPFGILALTSGIELLVDTCIIIKSLVMPGPDEPKSVAQRFKNIMNKDDRIYRMSNAALWFSINLACLFITGGLSIVLNLAGMAADVVVEGVRAASQIRRYNKMLEKVDHRIHELEASIKQNSVRKMIIKSQIKQIECLEKTGLETNKKFKLDSSIVENYKKLQNELEGLRDQEKEYKNLFAVKEQIQEQREAVKQARRRSVLIAVGVLVAMSVFFLAPVVQIPVLAVVGAWAALTIGSVLGGFARRAWTSETGVKLRNKIYHYFVPKEPEPPKPTLSAFKVKTLNHEKRQEQALERARRQTLLADVEKEQEQAKLQGAGQAQIMQGLAQPEIERLESKETDIPPAPPMIMVTPPVVRPSIQRTGTLFRVSSAPVISTRQDNKAEVAEPIRRSSIDQRGLV